MACQGKQAAVLPARLLARSQFIPPAALYTQMLHEARSCSASESWMGNKRPTSQGGRITRLCKLKPTPVKCTGAAEIVQLRLSCALTTYLFVPAAACAVE